MFAIFLEIYFPENSIPDSNPSKVFAAILRSVSELLAPEFRIEAERIEYTNFVIIESDELVNFEEKSTKEERTMRLKRRLKQFVKEKPKRELKEDMDRRCRSSYRLAKASRSPNDPLNKKPPRNSRGRIFRSA